MKGRHNIREQVAPLLEKVAAGIRKKFTSQDLAREKVLGLSRELIRFSSYAIRAIHRRELVEARENLSKAQENMAKLKAMLKDYPDAFYNLAYDAQKEYAEARLTLALTTDGKIQKTWMLAMRLILMEWARQWERCGVIYWIIFAVENWTRARIFSRLWMIFTECW